MSRQAADKRNKERARQQKQRDKAQVRQDRSKDKDAKGDLPPGVDPDIAGIIGDVKGTSGIDRMPQTGICSCSFSVTLFVVGL